MKPLPYDLDVWVPLLRGGASPVAVLDADDGADAVGRAGAALGPGERLALVGESAVGRADGLAPLEAALPRDACIERFVAFPGTGGGYVLVPTASAATVRGGLPLLPSGRARWRVARIGLEALAPLGVVRRLGLTELALVTRGASRAQADALVADAEHIALAAGVPDARQKLVARVLTESGAPRAIYKIGLRAGSHGAVRDERRALDRIAELAPELAPRLLDRGERDGVPWFAAEVLDGQRSTDVVTELHIEFLRRLAQCSLGAQPVAGHPLLGRAGEALTRLAAQGDDEWLQDFAGLHALLTADQSPLATAPAHGDFTPWNLAVARDGMRAFDWEAQLEAAPLLFDLFHFHIQTGVLVHRRDGADLFASLGELLEGAARPLLELGRMDGPAALRALGLYILHSATRDEELHRARPAPFVQVGWQRRARREIARRAVGCLRDRRVPWAGLPAFDAAA